MRIGIVSDLHCNAPALRAAIDRMGDVDELWCAGDIVNESRFCNDTVAVLREHGARCVQGNHEAMLLSGRGERARAAAHIDAGLLDYVGQLGQFVEVRVGGKRVVMTHATPFAPHSTYVYPHSPELQRMAELDADYLILGHTHQSMAVQVGSVLVINPGSVGQPVRQPDGPSVSYATLDTRSGEVNFDTFVVGPPS